MEPSAINEFVDVVDQLSSDQSLYEVEFTDELHSPILALGKLAIENFKDFCEIGREDISKISEGSVFKMKDAAVEYMELMMPPKACGGWCNCIKPARNGESYEKKLNVAFLHLSTAAFLAKALKVEIEAERSNVDSIRYAEYVNRMNHISTNLEKIAANNCVSDEARAKATKDLLTQLEAVDRFIKNYFENENDEFRRDALSQISATSEILRQRTQRRSLVSAQAKLQEIMNSAAASSGNSARDWIDRVELMQKTMKAAREQQTSGLRRVEDVLQRGGASEDMDKCRDECDMLFSDVDSKLRDSKKRWGVVKSQSVMRPVAVYTEENAPRTPDARFEDPALLMSAAGKKVVGVSKSVVAVPTKAVKGGVNLIASGVGEVANFAKTGAEGTLNLMSSTGKAMTNAGKAGLGAVSDTFTDVVGSGSKPSAQSKNPPPPKNVFDNITSPFRNAPTSTTPIGGVQKSLSSKYMNLPGL